MREVTTRELREIIDRISGSTAVSLDIETEPRMRKSGNPFLNNGVKKDVTLNGLIGFFYGNAVNNQLGREDKELNFKPQPRKWGERVGHVVEHKGNVYLEVKVQGSSRPTYHIDGETVDVEELRPFLYASRKPHTQDELDEQIILRDVKLSNILRIRMLNEEFVIVSDEIKAEKERQVAIIEA